MKYKIFSIITVVLLISLGLVSAQSTRIKIVSHVNPMEIMDEIRDQPYMLYFIAGKYFYSQGDLDRSLEMFDKAAEMNPEFVAAFHNMGVVHSAMGQQEEALSSFEDAIRIDASYSKAYFSLGVLSFEMGSYDDAILYYSSYLELEPQDANASFDLGQSYVARFRSMEGTGDEDYGDLEMAIEYLRKAEHLQPGFPHALDNIEILESIVETRNELIGLS